MPSQWLVILTRAIVLPFARILLDLCSFWFWDFFPIFFLLLLASSSSSNCYGVKLDYTTFLFILKSIFGGISSFQNFRTGSFLRGCWFCGNFVKIWKFYLLNFLFLFLSFFAGSLFSFLFFFGVICLLSIQKFILNVSKTQFRLFPQPTHLFCNIYKLHVYKRNI